MTLIKCSVPGCYPPSPEPQSLFWLFASLFMNKCRRAEIKGRCKCRGLFKLMRARMEIITGAILGAKEGTLFCSCHFFACRNVPCTWCSGSSKAFSGTEKYKRRPGIFRSSVTLVPQPRGCGHREEVYCLIWKSEGDTSNLQWSRCLSQTDFSKSPLYKFLDAVSLMFDPIVFYFLCHLKFVWYP